MGGILLWFFSRPHGDGIGLAQPSHELGDEPGKVLLSGPKNIKQRLGQAQDVT